MKQTISLVLLWAMFSSCGNSQSKAAAEQVKEIQAAIKPGTVATSAQGYMMTAKLNGKDWVATSMAQPETVGRIVGYSNNQYIGLPFSKSSLTIGRKIVLGEDEAVDLSLNNGCLWKNIKGAIEITKADAGWAEGKFFFTAACGSTNEAVSVTDGFFRIALKK
jgi:hypothetical protein